MKKIKNLFRKLKEFLTYFGIPTVLIGMENFTTYGQNVRGVIKMFQLVFVVGKIILNVARLCVQRRLIIDVEMLKKYVADADVIYLHWIAGGFLSCSDIENMAKTGKLIVFFMHDMWTMTGGCHHAFECAEYHSGCNNCQMFSSNCHLAKKQSEAKWNLFHKYNMCSSFDRH